MKLEEAAHAHELLENGQAKGKIVLIVGQQLANWEPTVNASPSARFLRQFFGQQVATRMFAFV